MIDSCIYHNKNIALLDTHIISRVKVTPPPPWEVARARRTPRRGCVTVTRLLLSQDKCDFFYCACVKWSRGNDLVLTHIHNIDGDMGFFKFCG